LRKLAASQPEADTGPLTAQEIDWLRRLTDGTSVSRLADHVGYSERMMFRLLAQTYAKLGVDNRTKAIIQARDRGWL
jgi:DNA-binding NarL/FixJ family response regulator